MRACDPETQAKMCNALQRVMVLVFYVARILAEAGSEGFWGGWEVPLDLIVGRSAARVRGGSSVGRQGKRPRSSEDVRPPPPPSEIRVIRRGHFAVEPTRWRAGEREGWKEGGGDV